METIKNFIGEYSIVPVIIGLALLLLIVYLIIVNFLSKYIKKILDRLNVSLAYQPAIVLLILFPPLFIVGLFIGHTILFNLL